MANAICTIYLAIHIAGVDFCAQNLGTFDVGKNIKSILFTLKMDVVVCRYYSNITDAEYFRVHSEKNQNNVKNVSKKNYIVLYCCMIEKIFFFSKTKMK